MLYARKITRLVYLSYVKKQAQELGRRMVPLQQLVKHNPTQSQPRLSSILEYGIALLEPRRNCKRACDLVLISGIS